MKKLITTLAITITLFTTAFAGDENAKNEIEKAFTQRFTGAQNVTWIPGNDYYKASFTYNGNWMNAYYGKSAELLGLTRNILSTQLPFFLQTNLKKKYSGYWITDLFELTDDYGFKYFITLKNADETIILESSNGTNWQTRK